MTLLQHVEALEGFQSLSNEKLPMTQAYKLAKIISELKLVVDPFFAARQDSIQKIRDEHADTGEEVPQDVIKGFQDQIQGMLEEEVESNIPSFDITDLSCEVPAKVVTACMPFITMEGDDVSDDKDSSEA